MRGHLRTLEQVINGFIENGFILERLVEQNMEDVAGASLEELGACPMGALTTLAQGSMRSCASCP